MLCCRFCLAGRYVAEGLRPTVFGYPREAYRLGLGRDSGCRVVHRGHIGIDVPLGSRSLQHSRVGVVELLHQQGGRVVRARALRGDARGGAKEESALEPHLRDCGER